MAPNQYDTLGMGGIHQGAKRAHDEVAHLHEKIAATAAAVTSGPGGDGHITANVAQAQGGYASMPHVQRPPNLHFPVNFGF